MAVFIKANYFGDEWINIENIVKIKHGCGCYSTIITQELDNTGRLVYKKYDHVDSDDCEKLLKKHGIGDVD